MIQKIQTLQRRLISKTEEIVEKDMLLEGKEQLYQDMKNILRLQPGPEVALEKNALQHSVKDKKRQLKAMASELNMLQAQVNEFKYVMEHKDRELNAIKRKLYVSKRKE